MKLKDAIKAMEEKTPVIHKFGQNITEYKQINSIIIKMECGEMKAWIDVNKVDRKKRKIIHS